MNEFYVFNGDADGICSLQQLLLAEDNPAAVLISGVKRDVELLARAQAVSGDRVTVLDISLESNRSALQALLEREVKVRYFDHHFAGRIPHHVHLETFINQTPDRGTSALVDRYLNGRFRAWAVVGTFGDNFDTTARQLAAVLGLTESQLAGVRELGILLNYNSYGETVDDLHIHPLDLFRSLHPYPDPVEFLTTCHSISILREGYLSDLNRAEHLRPEFSSLSHALYILPEAPWSRRVGGVFANRLAQKNHYRAHAILTTLPAGGYQVSVRAPLDRPFGADTLCRGYPGGGGRQAAAGINLLAERDLERFISAFCAAFNT